MATYGDLATDEVIAWLLEGDSSVRWQVRAHLLDESPSAVEAERAKVATEGWGARYLALQDPEGTWSRSLYAPKWTSTHYTLLTLWRLVPDRVGRQAQPNEHPACAAVGAMVVRG